MGNCGGKTPQKHTKVSADQQAKMNEASKTAATNIENDVKKAEQELKASIAAEEAEKKRKEEEEAAKAKEEEEKEEKEEEEEEEKKPEEEEEPKEPSETPSEAAEKRREAESKLKKANKRLNKLDVLRAARDLGALTLDDFNAAVRRLHSCTGNDPTNPENMHALPEGFEWFTAMLDTMWPSIREYCKNSVEETLQPAISRACNGYGVSCNIEHFDLGSNTPAFGPITARYVDGIGATTSDPKGGVEIALGITIRSNMQLEMKTSVGTIGVQNYTFNGTLYFWFRPFLDVSPFVGAMEFAFVNRPVLELDWTGFVGGALEFMGLQNQVRDTIDNFIADNYVVPNFYVYPMSTDPRVDIAKLRSPKPEGVVRITITGVRNLPDVGGDIHVKVKVGAQEWDTPNARNKTVPVWTSEEASYDFLVYNQDQWVLLELKDSKGEDNVIGHALNVPVNRLVKRRQATVPLTKQSFPVTNAKAEPTTISVKAVWISIDSENTSDGACLASLRVDEVRGVPLSLADRGPFRIRATTGTVTSGTTTSVSRPGWIKPKSEIVPDQLLEQLRQHQGKKPELVAKLHGLLMPGDVELVAQALAKNDDGKWSLGKIDDGSMWWMTEMYLLDYMAFPDDMVAKWSAAKQGSNSLPKKERPKINDTQLKRRRAYFKSYETLYKWNWAIIASQNKQKSSTDPYFCQVVHLRASCAAEVKVELVDKDKTAVAMARIPIKDEAVGDEPDAYGPFTLRFTDEDLKGKTCEISGDITVRNLMVADKLPANWNVQADSLDATAEFTEWWKQEEFVMDWADWYSQMSAPDATLQGFLPFGSGVGKKWMSLNWPEGNETECGEAELAERNEYYMTGKEGIEGSGVTDEKQQALDDCLKAGALTWQDYDCIVARLNGDEDAPAVAETLEWLNMLVSAMWPGINKYTVKLVKESVEPALDAAAKSYLSALSVKFTKVNLGKREPQWGTVQCRKIRSADPKDGLIYWGCELAFNDIAFESQIDIQMQVTMGQSVTVGVKDLLFKGSWLVRLGPMLNKLPLIGAVQMVMPNAPEVDLKMQGDVGGILEALKDKIPSLDTLSRNVITNGVASSCAIPNYYVYPMVRDLDVTELRYPTPLGIIRLEMKEGLHLRAGDTDNSDSYVIAKVGSTVHQTKPVTSLNPKWGTAENNVMDFVVYSEDQNVDIEVFDADFIGADDTLGAIWHKGTVLGGGIDEIKRGIPVKNLRKMGTAVLPLQEKIKDVVCSPLSTRGQAPSGPTVYELRDVVGYDQMESVLILQAKWISREEKGEVNQAYIMSVKVHNITGLNVGCNGPYKVRCTAGGATETSRAGTGDTSDIPNAEDLAKQVQRMGRAQMSNDAIAKSLKISSKQAEKCLELKLSLEKEDVEKLTAWHAECVKTIGLNKQLSTPEFNQILHIPFQAPRESEMAGDAWSCPCMIDLLDKKGNVIGSTQREVSTTKALLGQFPMEVEGASGCKFNCDIELTGLKGRSTDPHVMTEEEEVLRLTPFKGPEFVDTPEGVQPKIGMYVVARNLVKAKELNWGVTNKKEGEMVKRGDRPQPEGKVVGWTQDNDRAIIDFGANLGEWRVKPVNLANAPPPLPPPPPPPIVYIVSDEVMETEGQFDLTEKKCRDQPYWEREAYGEGEVWRLFTTDCGRWAVGPAHMQGVAYIRTTQPHYGRFPHMMGHELPDEFAKSVNEPLPKIKWQRMDIGLDENAAVEWVQDATIECTLVKPIAREFEEILDEMEDQIMEDIMDDLEADLLEDIQADLEADLEADLQADLEADLEKDLADDIADEIDIADVDLEEDAVDEEAEAAAMAEAEAAAEEERRRQEEEAEEERRREEDERRQEEEERRRAEAEEKAREAEEKAEEERRQKEEERQRAEDEKKSKEQAAADRKKREEDEARRKEEEAQKKREEEAAKKKAAEDKRKKEAEEKKKKEEAEKKKKEEEKKKKEEEERKKKEAEKKKKEEEARKKKEEEERKKREEEERRRKEELRKKQAEAERKKREQERKARKAAKRKGKMESLTKALEVGAMTKMDHVTALRRLQSVTGEDPTNGDRAYSLPETMQWFTTTMEVFWPHLRTLLAQKLHDICAPALESVAAHVSIGKIDMGNNSPAFGPISCKFIDGLDGTPKSTVEVGLGITYQAGVDIIFKVGEEEATVQRLKCVGMMYFWLRPFINEPPFVGGLQAAFVNPPTV